jgi:hypothetical protein
MVVLGTASETHLAYLLHLLTLTPIIHSFIITRLPTHLL